MQEARQVKLRNLLAYGFGEFYGGGSFVVISLLFMFFLTDVVGMLPALAGLVVLIGKGWDAISDPIMGYITDNIQTRFGRRRFFFLIGVIPIAVTFLILWIQIKTDSQFLLFLYYSLSYLLFSSVFTMVMIPYRALNAEMSTDYKVRTWLTSSKMMFSQVSSLLSATLPKEIVDRLYPEDSGQGFFVMGIVFGLFYALPWIIVFLGTWEIPELQKKDKTGKVTFFRNFQTLFISRSFRLQLGMYISSYAAMDILMAMFIYYLTYYIGRQGIFSLCLGSMLITSMLAVPLYTWIANRRGKGFAYIVGLGIWGAITALTLGMSSATPTYQIVILCVLIGFGMSAGILMPWAMLPEIIDVDELVSGIQRAGTCSGSMTLVRKLVQAFTLFIFGVILDLIGYVPNVAQTESTLFWIKVIFFLLPGLLIAAGIVIAVRFKITPKTHTVLKTELERLREGGQKSEVASEAKDVCEVLSGVSYEKLYRA